MNVPTPTPTLWKPPAPGEYGFPIPVGRPLYVRTHLDLPSEDPVPTNQCENPQAALLTESIEPRLLQLHPDGNYTVGHDNYIFYADLEPAQTGAKSPDWYYVPGVPPLLQGEVRRSYVIWREKVLPRVVIEFASGDGSEERDRTPKSGKFWTYEQGIRAEYYAIYHSYNWDLEVFRLVNGAYQPVPANEQGQFPIEVLGVALGIWRGRYRNLEWTWLRWFDAAGKILPTAPERADEAVRLTAVERERADAERERADAERERADAERERSERRAAKLRELGVDPDSV